LNEKEKYMAGLGFPEMVVILIIALVIFGPNRLPALGEGLGKAIRGFKDGLRDSPEAIAKDSKERTKA
jgi:sec-independent protein translocase protein TatA